MANTIRKRDAAQIADFATAVKNYAEELNAHAAHMVAVAAANQARTDLAEHDSAETQLVVAEARETDPDKKVEIARKLAVSRNRRQSLQTAAEAAQPYPAPQAPPVVEQAVGLKAGPEGEEYVPDYELVDEIPLAADDEAGLRRRKEALFAEVTRLETEAIDAIWPPGKRRADHYRMQDINAADSARVKDIVTAAGDRPVEPDELHRMMIGGRPQDHAEDADKDEKRRAAIEKIQRKAAAMMAEIEDLTTADSHLWIPPEKFSE